MRAQNKAYLYASLVVLFWSTIGSAIKLTLRFIDFQLMLLYVNFVAVVFLFIVLLIQNKWHILIKQSFKEISISAFLGLLNPFLYYLVLFKAYDLLQAQEAVVLNYTWPVILVVLSIPILKQKIGWKSITAIMISFFGIYVIATMGNIIGFQLTNIYGVSLAIGSAIIWGIFWILNVKDQRDDQVKMFLNFLFGFIYILILVLSNKKLSFPEFNGLLGAIYIGLFEMGITFIIWLQALKLSATTAKVSNLIFLSPFISLIIVHYTVGEKILPSTFIGLFLIISGIVMQRFGERKTTV
ncbi:DMT family transporter [Bacteroidota bacterium]